MKQILIHSLGEIKLIRFTLRHSLIDTTYSSIFTGFVPKDLDSIFLDDIISFYSDEILVFQGSITEIREGQITATSESAVTAGNITSDKIIFFNKYSVRVALDFNILPDQNFETSTHSFITSDITHYIDFTEVKI